MDFREDDADIIAVEMIFLLMEHFLIGGLDPDFEVEND